MSQQSCLVLIGAVLGAAVGLLAFFGGAGGEEAGGVGYAIGLSGGGAGAAGVGIFLVAVPWMLGGAVVGVIAVIICSMVISYIVEKSGPAITSDEEPGADAADEDREEPRG